WSPDGSKITFARAGGCFWDLCSTQDLWVVNADGSNPTKLADRAGGAAWSPDGTKIIFGKSVNFAQSDIYTMNPDGSGLTNVTNTNGKDESSPSWQPLSLPTVVNPIDDPQFFVRQQYRDFLSREPDAPGQAHWTGEITMCSDAANRFSGETEGQCIDRKRTN